MKLVTFQDPIFGTIQGEGVLTGMPSTFVRTWGCNFDCSWCDTKDSWQLGSKYRELSVDEVAGVVKAIRLRHVVLTGGNPALQGDEMFDLMLVLGNQFHFTMETQGEPYHPVMRHVDLLSLSPKLGKPFDQRCISLEKKYGSHIQFKVVVCDEADLVNALTFLELAASSAANVGYSPGEIHCILQPEYSKGRKWVTKVSEWLVQETEFSSWVRVMPQFHKSVYGVM